MGAMSQPRGLGAFTRMLRGNKIARRMVQNKVHNARQQMTKVHLNYLRMLHGRGKKRTVG